MAAWLLALAALQPLLLGSVGAVSESDIYADGRKNIPTAVLAERWRQLEAARCSGQDPKPLLWRSNTGNVTVYLLATYPVPNEDMLPLSPQVQNAMECADVAFFELACNFRDMGNYMAHCYHYSATEPRDSVPSRIPPEDMTALQGSVNQLVEALPAECQGAAANLTRSMQTLLTSRKTLKAFYHQAITLLHTSNCKRKTGTQMYTESLRMAWGSTRPIFGLRDIATECATHTGNSEQADQELARKMIQVFSDAEWRANMTRDQEVMEDILHCGDLGRLTTLPDLTELPELGENFLGQRNQELAFSVEQAMAQNQGKSILVVMGITHFLDWGKMKSVMTLLTEKTGTTFQRITTGTDLSCSASSYSAPGAKELGRCLLPPWKSQPASCDNFKKAFKAAEAAAAPNYPTPNKTLHIETMGRTKMSNNCSQCVNSDEKCECEFTWGNDTAFTDLCNRTVVDGVRGMVVYMDLTRNPGSAHKGPGLAEKTVKGLYQSCIATSCDIGFRQDIALRHWYEQEPGSQLAGGIVTLRFPGQQMSGSGGIMGTIAVWPWWAWLLFGLVITACTAGLIKLFMMPPKRKKVKRAMQIGDPQMPLPVENHFQKVDTASRLDESLERPPSPSRYEQQQQQPPQQSWQQMQQVQQQQYQQPPSREQQQLQMQQMPPQGYGQEGLRSGRAGPDDGGWPFPSPQPGTRAFTGTEPEPRTQAPMWQPQPEAPPLDQQGAFQGYDNSILAQAMQMQQMLGEQGAQAVQSMKMQANANWQRQNMPGGQSLLPPPIPAGGPASYGPMTTPPGSLSLQAQQMGMPPPFAGGQPGQQPFSGGAFQPASTQLGAAGMPGQFMGQPAPMYGQPPPSPQRTGPPSPGMYQQMGQAAAAPPMGYPYARMA